MQFGGGLFLHGHPGCSTEGFSINSKHLFVRKERYLAEPALVYMPNKDSTPDMQSDQPSPGDMGRGRQRLEGKSTMYIHWLWMLLPKPTSAPVVTPSAPPSRAALSEAIRPSRAQRRADATSEALRRQKPSFSASSRARNVAARWKKRRRVA